MKVSSVKLAFNYIRKPNITTVIIFYWRKALIFFHVLSWSYDSFRGEYL